LCVKFENRATEAERAVFKLHKEVDRLEGSLSFIVYLSVAGPVWCGWRAKGCRRGDKSPDKRLICLVDVSVTLYSTL